MSFSGLSKLLLRSGCMLLLTAVATPAADNPLVTLEIGEALRASLGGVYQALSVTKLGAPITVSSFSLAFAWDSRALTFFRCEAGSALDRAEWDLELSDDSTQIANSPGSPARIIRIAGKYRGSELGGTLAPDGEWLKLSFASTGDWGYNGAIAPVVFAFVSCTDNTISSASKDTLFTVLEADTNSSWIATKRDFYGDSSIAPKGVVFSPDKRCRCDKSAESECMQAIALRNGGIEFLLNGALMGGYGDLNLNGIAYEVADLQRLERILLGDGKALDSNIQYRQAQLTAADANSDQLSATVADLQYVVRVISGDAKSYPKLNRNSALAEARLSRSSDVLEIDSDNEVGAVRLTYEGMVPDSNFQNLSPLNMQVLSSDSITTVLLSCKSDSGNLQRKLPRGKNQLLSTIKKVKLISAEASDYDGNQLITRY